MRTTRKSGCDSFASQLRELSDRLDLDRAQRRCRMFGDAQRLDWKRIEELEFPSARHGDAAGLRRDGVMRAVFRIPCQTLHAAGDGRSGADRRRRRHLASESPPTKRRRDPLHEPLLAAVLTAEQLGAAGEVAKDGVRGRRGDQASFMPRALACGLDRHDRDQPLDAAGKPHDRTHRQRGIPLDHQQTVAEGDDSIGPGAPTERAHSVAPRIGVAVAQRLQQCMDPRNLLRTRSIAGDRRTHRLRLTRRHPDADAMGHRQIAARQYLQGSHMHEGHGRHGFRRRIEPPHARSIGNDHRRPGERGGSTRCITRGSTRGRARGSAHGIRCGIGRDRPVRSQILHGLRLSGGIDL